MLLPLRVLTSSALDQRTEFILCVIAAVAGSGSDGRTVAAVIAAATVAKPSTYGNVPRDQAASFLWEWGNTQAANFRIFQAAERAYSSLVSGGAAPPTTPPA